MKTKFNGILTLLLAFVVQITFAQELTVSGTVVDENNLPLPGATVLVKGTTNGATTDFDGNYSIKANNGDTLEFSYIGYASQAIAVTGNSINVSMTLDNTLDEIVIEAAYDVKRTKATTNSSIQAISAETIENRTNASVVQTLQGQVAGLNITTGSGQPGANSEINLRGVGSINGNTEPLFVMDGVVIDEDNFRSLNPNDIASVSVLKDAGATAIYGNRGANGVIVIKTKTGKFNAGLKVNYTVQTSIASLQGNKYDLMNSTEQLELERTYGNGRGAGMTDAEIAALAKYSNTDWTEVFFRDALTHSHNLSLTGGGEKTRTFTSFAYTDQEGILKGSSLKRFNIRNNINGKSNDEKFTYGTSVSINYSKSDEPNSIGSGAINRNFVLGAFQSVPYISPHDYTNGEALLSPLSFTNTPLFLLDRLATYTRFEEEIKILGSVNAGYKFTDNLSYNARLSSEFTEEWLTRAEGPNSFNALLFAESGNTTPGFQDQNSTRSLNVNFVQSLNYSKTFNEKHTVDAGLYTEYYKAHYRQFGYRQEGLDPRTFYPGDGDGFIGDNATNDFFVDVANADIRNAGLFSYFGTLDYDYDKKYGFGGTLRRDASYRFRSSNRWGTFWAVSGRWNIDQENFMANSPFQMLKLRASHGITGNQDVSGVAGQFRDFAGGNLVLDLYGTGAGYGGQNSLGATQIANTDLKWETITQTNVGLDFEVLDRKLRGSIDVYKKTTDDLYVSQPTPAYSGTTSLAINNGSLENTGVDVNLAYDVFKNTDGFNLTVKGNANYNKQARYDDTGDTTVQQGGILGEVYTYIYAGVNPANGNLLFYDIDGNLTENPNEDTDRVFTGKNRYPDYQGSFGFDAEYKGFFLTTQFNYAIGVDRFDFDYSGFIDPTAIGQFRASRDLLDAWTPTNTVTNIPSLTATNLNLAGDRFLQSADYVRLRNITLGYNFKKRTLEALKMKTLRIFATAENMITFTGWRGFDVEGFANTQNNYPTPRTMSVGLEVGF